MLVVVHVRHHAVLARSGQLNRSENFSGEFVTYMKFQRGVRDKLTGALTECTRLDKKISGNQLNRPTSATGVWNINASQL